MPYGYAGAMLRVDLTNGVTALETPSTETLEKWIGGAGLGVKYVYDEVRPSISWDHPENRVVIATGPLGGLVRGSGTYCMVTKGPMTEGLAVTQANGYFGAFLKLCGYDGLILQGRSPKWVYLYIDEERVEIRPAQHLLGLDTVQTQDLLRQQLGLGPTQLSICCIGPAGENLVRFACVVSDYGHVAAHNGVGAVLGAKKIKAIAVKRGSKSIPVFDKAKLRELEIQMDEAAKSTPNGRDCYQWGTNAGHAPFHKIGGLPVRNLTTNIFPEHVEYVGTSLRTRFEYKKRPCWRCNWNHCGTLRITSGPFQGMEVDEPEYEAMAAMGPLIGITDPARSIVLADWVDRMGMDVNETGWLVAWIMECCEKGYLSTEDIDGLIVRWGDLESTKILLRNIAVRKGFGDLLAEGVKRVAKQLGGAALTCAVFTEKGNPPRGHDHRAIWTEFLDTCVSNTGTIETVGGSINVKQHGLDPMTDPFSWEQVAKQNATVAGRRIFEDSLGVCRFVNGEDINLTVAAIEAATGKEMTVDEAMKVGKRIINLMRIFNLKNGITAELDNPSLRYASVPTDGPAAGRSVGAIFQEMKRRYYELMGWDPNGGKPLPETLRALDLAEVIADMP